MKLISVICCIIIATAESYGEPDFTGFVNLALNQPASQSSTSWGGLASYGVDGNKNSVYFDGSCTHTAETVDTHWWQVELKTKAVVYQVKIQNRNDEGHRLADLNISVGNTTDDFELCAYFEGPGGNGGIEYTLNCTQPLIGRYLKIQKRVAGSTLSMCEVEVMGLPDAADCSEAGVLHENVNGAYSIYPCGTEGGRSFAQCIFGTGGAWTVFQRRINGSVDFQRNWAEYKSGFGVVGDEYWLGNDALHCLTSQGAYTLRVDLTYTDDSSKFAEYSTFSISDENDGYRLSAGVFSGTAGDALGNQTGQVFDATADTCPQSETFTGAWWYCYSCNSADLNAKYDPDSQAAGTIVWKDTYPKTTTMMLKKNA